MALPAAKAGDRIVGMDVHVVMITGPAGPVPTPTPSPFNGVLSTSLSPTVLIAGRPAATVGSFGVNTPPHIPSGGPFQRPPTNLGRIMSGSPTVFINGRPAARVGDPATTCGDPVDSPTGAIIATGASTVLIG
jgi:uncharacterized Zn-binding protein involved in type VI secretion